MAKVEKTKVKFISDTNIAKTAISFLEKHYSHLTLPIDIESIAEKQLGMSLLTVKGLESRIGAPGFIGQDFDAITIDDFIFNNRQARSNFTIAHEIGHSVLHRDVYRQLCQKTNSGYDFVQFRALFSNKEWDYFEIQANKFASYVLLPTCKVDAMVKCHLRECGGSDGFDIDELQRLILDMVEGFEQSKLTCIYKLEELYPDLVAVSDNAPIGI